MCSAVSVRIRTTRIVSYLGLAAIAVCTYWSLVWALTVLLPEALLTTAVAHGPRPTSMQSAYSLNMAASGIAAMLLWITTCMMPVLAVLGHLAETHDATLHSRIAKHGVVHAALLPLSSLVRRGPQLLSGSLRLSLLLIVCAMTVLPYGAVQLAGRLTQKKAGRYTWGCLVRAEQQRNRITALAAFD